MALLAFAVGEDEILIEDDVVALPPAVEVDRELADGAAEARLDDPQALRRPVKKPATSKVRAFAASGSALSPAQPVRRKQKSQQRATHGDPPSQGDGRTVGVFP